MTAVVVVLLVGVLLSAGALIGHSYSRRVLRSEIRRTAEVRRLVGEQWRAVQADRAERRWELHP